MTPNSGLDRLGFGWSLDSQGQLYESVAYVPGWKYRWEVIIQ